MESKRQQQFAKLIQQDLSDIFQKDMRTTFGKAFVTITDVKMTPDLAIARVYLSFMLANDKAGLLQDIREKSKHIRGILGNRIRNQARIIPNLEFFIDDTAEYAAQMDALISGLDIPPLKEGEEIELD
ncbi:30S ribosome-binding factor RbfA [Arcicella sp. DC2W]|uniref:Ribosome-binding factor A n=1 Tax=Arcicella gelida TaxID=2984195 RepID=A0ABU5S717_9BACT|nr:30S ribosome-binding factor RbfA [Arcicella sp. DC2W]MEA5404260.1 30S ribosome-binding factor RbfA [Arcicella sp. DC2W]|eukprot:Opistho-1_new@24008